MQPLLSRHSVSRSTDGLISPIAGAAGPRNNTFVMMIFFSPYAPGTLLNIFQDLSMSRPRLLGNRLKSSHRHFSISTCNPLLSPSSVRSPHRSFPSWSKAYQQPPNISPARPAQLLPCPAHPSCRSSWTTSQDHTLALHLYLQYLAVELDSLGKEDVAQACRRTSI